MVRLGLFLALLVFVVVLGVVVIGKVNALTSEENLKKLADAASRRLEKKKDHYMKQLEMLVDKVQPPLTKAFMSQAQKDMPLYLKVLDKERKPLLDNLRAKFSDQLDKRYKTVQPRYEKVLAEEFPQSKDPKVRERMVANLDLAMQKLLKKYYVNDLEAEFQHLNDTWDHFPAASAPGKGELPTEEQFTAALWDLLRYRLTHSQGMVLGK
jgi:hypothetical protein